MERSAEHRSPNSLPRCLLWMMVVGVSWAQREVTVQQGPLYRTVSSHVTVWCKVSGYQGPTEQNFQYSIYLPTAPKREVQMVSTQDTGFSYASYSSRVSSGDIYIERLAGDHTVLHIRHLQERDTGEYECHTPNTDPKFYGSYSAKVNLRVLPDTLLVTMPPAELERPEGSSLEVTCLVSRASSQHTHLSVCWLLAIDDDDDVDILSLSRDFVLVPGESFSERFTSGEIRLDKLSDSAYRLTIKELRLSDQGHLFCRGSEWIQDPDGHWTKITEKKSEKTTVKVSALQGGDFQAQVQIPETSVNLRDVLEITCSISRYQLQGGRFRVSWLLDGDVMATWDPSGVSSFYIKYRTREEKGQITVRRRNQDTWTLRISPSTEQDTGSYLCEVTEEETQRRRQSSPATLTIHTPGLPVQNVTLSSAASNLYEGDSVSLYCQASSPAPSVDVTWLALRPSGRWVAVALLRHDGKVEASGEYLQKHKSGHMTAQRLGNGGHTLTLDSLVDGDGGQYMCRLTECSQKTDGERRNRTYNSNVIQIDVRRLGSSLEVVLMSRGQQVTSGSSAQLFCIVKAAYSFREKRLSWSWDFKPDSASFRTLVNVSGEGDVSWGESTPGFNGEAQLSIQGTTSTLTIHRVQRQHHQGAYRCRVQVLSHSVPRASATSITMNIKVKLPAARLAVDAADRTVLVTAGQDEAVVFCQVKAVTPGAVLHVGWFLVSPASPSAVNIVNVTHEGLTSHQPGFSWFLSERVSSNTIILRILRPQLPGSYYCAVRELLLESGEWVTLAERMSGVTRVTLRASDKALRVHKENVSRSEPTGGDMELRCFLEELPGSAAIFSVSWYFQAAPSSYPRLLYRARRDGVTEYNEALVGRLQVGATALGNYSLTLRSVGQEDAGTYHCRLEEWRLQKDAWRLEASDTSGYLQLRITAPDDRLSVNLTEVALVAPGESSLDLPCQVVSTSVPDSVFSITWWKVADPGHQLLYNASHLGQSVYPGEEGRRFQYERTSEQTFQLRILRALPPDTGIYYCRVQEWARTPRGVWYQIGQQTGGNISVTIQTAGVNSEVCSSPALFYVLLLFSLLFLFLLLVLGWKLVTRWRNKAGRSPPRNGNTLWTSQEKVNGRREDEPDSEGEQIPL
ncbi:immunoglobulin superfamily member 3-like isoform 1-T1 [Anomaloglossus baeobatrachus]|uniref:immunoglobulin superfamily member 3-like isoform X1 n=1 Tax=Anomaloglossus baeobatrachus TaxID=238106 RepID=UPI003F503394